MSGRRSFLALIGGASVTGFVVVRKAIAAPTLTISSAMNLPPPAERPGAFLYPLLSTHESDVHALAHIRSKVPLEVFQDFLEGGLRNARFYNGRDEATLERVIDAAVEKHGSIAAAMRAGAL